MITATLKNYRISPRKVRIVADMVRGKKAEVAKVILANAAKKAKHPISDLLDSAIANAKHDFKIEASDLVVKEIRVDQGYVLKRFMPVSRGSAHPIKKRTSHVRLVLAPVGENTAKNQKASKQAKNRKPESTKLVSDKQGSEKATEKKVTKVKVEKKTKSNK